MTDTIAEVFALIYRFHLEISCKYIKNFTAIFFIRSRHGHVHSSVRSCAVLLVVATPVWKTTKKQRMSDKRTGGGIIWPRAVFCRHFLAVAVRWSVPLRPRPTGHHQQSHHITLVTGSVYARRRRPSSTFLAPNTWPSVAVRSVQLQLKIWNSLSTAVQSSESLDIFRRRLKTELFERSYRACQTTLLLRDSLSLSRSFLLWLQPWSLSTIMLLWHSFFFLLLLLSDRKCMTLKCVIVCGLLSKHLL